MNWKVDNVNLVKNCILLLICISNYVTIKAFAWLTNKIGALKVHTRIPGS
jgi:hypothetical protein